MDYEEVRKQERNLVMQYFFQHLQDSPLHKCAGTKRLKSTLNPSSLNRFGLVVLVVS